MSAIVSVLSVSTDGLTEGPQLHSPTCSVFRWFIHVTKARISLGCDSLAKPKHHTKFNAGIVFPYPFGGSWSAIINQNAMRSPCAPHALPMVTRVRAAESLLGLRGLSPWNQWRRQRRHRLDNSRICPAVGLLHCSQGQVSNSFGLTIPASRRLCQCRVSVGG